MIDKRQSARLLAWSGLVLWGIGLVGYFFSTQPWTGLYVDNQYTYFIQGLRLSGRHPYLAQDWFAHTKPLHITFTYLVAGLARLGVLQQGMAVFDVLFRLVFLGTAGLLVWAFWGFAGPDSLRGNPLRRSAFMLAVLSLYVLSLWPVFQMSAFFEAIGITSAALVWQKFGFYYSFGGFSSFRYYTEPVSFSVLILTGLAVLPYRRWKLAAGLLGVAALFHASFLLHTGVIVGCLTLYLFFSGQKRTAFWAAGLYAVLVSPLVLYILTQMTDPLTAEANGILAQFRVPHHALPSRWWDLTDVAHAVVMGLAVALLAWKGKGIFRWLPAVMAGYTALGIAYVARSGDLTVAILMPWRASGTLYALAQLAVLTAGVYVVVKVLTLLHKHAADFFLLVPAALLCMGIATYGLFTILPDEYEAITTQALYPFYRQIQQTTEPDSLVLTPSRQTAFRLAAERAQYVDWKSHPYQGTEVLAWWERITFVEAFYAPETTAADRQRYCQAVDVDYYMLSAAVIDESEPVITAWEDWTLVACP